MMTSLLLPILLQLGWKELIMVTDLTLDFEEVSLQSLPEHGVQHVLISGSQAMSGQWVGHVMRTGEDSWRPLNIVMLCSLPCVQAALDKATELDVRYGTQTAFAVSSRWLLVQTGGHSLLDRLHLNNTMDNVLLVQRTLSSRIENGTKIWYGLLANLLDVLSHSLNFTYEIMEPADGVWGSGTAADADVGFFGHVIRGEADIGLAPTELHPDRHEMMDFTTPVFYTSVVMAYRKPDTRDQMMTAVVPLSGDLLMLIGAALVFVTLFIVVLELGAFFIIQHTDLNIISLSPVCLSTLSGVAQTTGAGLLWRSSEVTLRSRPGRVLLSSWWMFSLLVGAVYSGTLTAFLSVNKEEQLFTSLEDLVTNQHDYKWGTFGRTGITLTLQRANDSTYEKVWRGIERFAKTDPDVLSEDTARLAHKVRSENFVLLFQGLWSRTILEECDIEQIDAGMRQSLVSLVLPKGSALTKPVSDLIERVHAAGLLSQWTATWFPRATCPSPQGPKVISLLHMQGVLLVLPVGVALALAVLVGETQSTDSVYQRGMMRKQRARN